MLSTEEVSRIFNAWNSNAVAVWIPYMALHLGVSYMWYQMTCKSFRSGSSSKRLPLLLITNRRLQPPFMPPQL